jgi:hypothetical protein|uniref:Mitochondrial resolvase Ydc2 catalytic domain-containing protein n=1 Tax=viral metagenome TaxID=1070528 RepID=A0A6C0CZT3_9ZZZZ
MNKTVCAFDIGTKNFCFYISEFTLSNLLNISNILDKDRYIIDGTCSTEMSELLKQVFCEGKTIFYKNSDLTANCTNKTFDIEILHNMYDLLDTHATYFDTCDVFLVEQQMNFGKNRNPVALRLSYYCQAYFTFRYGRFKRVIEFPAYHKTQILGCPKLSYKTKKGVQKYKAVDKPTRKKWNIEKGYEILEKRGEHTIIETVKKIKKRDDILDCCCMIECYKYLLLDKKMSI